MGNAAGEALDGALPAMPRVKAHLRALPYQDVAAALAVVEASGASMAAKLCLRFLVLTAARSGEARGVTWDQVDETERLWVIPGDRMKGGQAAVVRGGAGRSWPGEGASGRIRPDLPIAAQARAPAVEHESDQGSEGHGSRPPCDCPWVQNELPNLGERADQRRARRNGAVARACSGIVGRASLCQIGLAREASPADGAVEPVRGWQRCRCSTPRRVRSWVTRSVRLARLHWRWTRPRG